MNKSIQERLLEAYLELTIALEGLERDGVIAREVLDLASRRLDSTQDEPRSTRASRARNESNIVKLDERANGHSSEHSPHPLEDLQAARDFDIEQ